MGGGGDGGLAAAVRGGQPRGNVPRLDRLDAEEGEHGPRVDRLVPDAVVVCEATGPT